MVFAVGKCLREGLLTTPDDFRSHDREAIALHKFKLSLKACRSLSTSFTCVVTANVYE